MGVGGVQGWSMQPSPVRGALGTASQDQGSLPEPVGSWWLEEVAAAQGRGKVPALPSAEAAGSQTLVVNSCPSPTTHLPYASGTWVSPYPPELDQPRAHC